jgi:TonB family protein
MIVAVGAPLLALLAASAALQGVEPDTREGVVAGVVRGATSGEPLAYARIQVVGDTVSDWTDAAGAYRMTGLPRGEHRIRAVHPGHDTLDVSLLVPGDRPVRLDLTLTPRPGPVVDALADFEPIRVEFTLPALLNTVDIAALLQRLYPPELTRDRLGGEAVLRLWLDESGRVVRGLVSSSSGYGALDSIALIVADSMRFRPARRQQEGVRVIVRIPVLFTVPGVDAGVGETGRPLPPRRGRG